MLKSKKLNLFHFFYHYSFRLIGIIFIFLIFFPYIKFSNFPSDTQPGAFIFSLIIIIFTVFKRDFNIPILLRYLLISFLSAASIFLVSNPTFIGVRSLFGYLSIFSVAYAVYKVIPTIKSDLPWLTSSIIFIWIIVGVIQFLFDPLFLTNLISSSRGAFDDNRGITSLAVEPTYYAQSLFFLYFIVINLKSKLGKIFLSTAITASIIFLSQSSMFILIFFAALVTVWIYWIYKTTFWNKAIVITSIIVFGFIIFNFYESFIFPESRIFSLLNIVLERGPLGLFYIDKSSNIRLAHIYFSLRGAIDNFLLPNGFNSFLNFFEIAHNENSFFWHYNPADRIMSLFGGVIYEIGIFSLIILGILSYSFINYSNRISNKYLRVFLLASSFIIMFTAVPLATPFLGYIIGVNLYYSNTYQFNIKN